MNLLLHGMQVLIQKGHRFAWPEQMEWSQDAEDRPFLSFLKDFVNRDDSPGLDSPLNAMKSYVREFRTDLTPVEQRQMLVVTGFCTDVFQFVFPNSTPFFDFCMPMVAKTTRSSACSVCIIQEAYRVETTPECMLELRNIDGNLTLQEHVEGYFNDEFTSEMVQCRCNVGQVQIETKYDVVTLPSSFIGKLRNSVVKNSKSLHIVPIIYLF